MFGERYFATRERLGDVVSGILSIAKETGVDSSGKLNADVLERGLSTPFLFVICGEVNAGKSTFLNALFGMEVCKANVLPETDRVLWYKYDQKSYEIPITPILTEKYLPIEFLRDFNLVDTPGTNSVEKNHQGITERFMPAADLILFVFPVSNPWGAATWDFLCKQPDEIQNRVVFVLQQADQRDAQDLDVILGHLRDLALKRIGRVPPVFAISAKNALEAKKNLPFSADQLSASGIPAIEDFISKSVCESPSRKRTLQNLRIAASGVMNEVEDKIEEQTRKIESDGRFLEELERDIDNMRSMVVRKQTANLGGLSDTFKAESQQVAKNLDDKLSFFPSIKRLFSGDDTAIKMESHIQDRLQNAVEQATTHDTDELVKSCLAHWRTLTQRINERMLLPLESEEKLAERLHDSANRFVSRMSRASTQGIGNLRVRGVLDLAVRKRSGSLKLCFALTLIALILAGVTGGLHVPFAPYIFLFLAIIAFAVTYHISSSTAEATVSEYRERLLNSCDSFISAMRGDYEEGLRLFFRDYAQSLESVRNQLITQKHSLSPRLQQWNGLFLALKAIEQEIS